MRLAGYPPQSLFIHAHLRGQEFWNGLLGIVHFDRNDVIVFVSRSLASGTTSWGTGFQARVADSNITMEINSACGVSGESK